jgi:hypothetical protein
MEKEFIPYEQALALKELGFDEPCLGYFDPLYKKLVIWEKESTNSSSNWVSAPTFSQAFRWFREKYGYDVSIKKCTPSEYKFEIEQLFAEGDNYYFIDFSFPSHEVAELECLKKLIKIIKTKIKIV